MKTELVKRLFYMTKAELDEYTKKHPFTPEQKEEYIKILMEEVVPNLPEGELQRLSERVWSK